LAQTNYKFQGETLQRLLIHLNKIPGRKGHTYQSLVVLFSRCTNGAHYYLFPPLPGETDRSFSHLAELLPPDELMIYLMGFMDDNEVKKPGWVKWDPAQAKKAVGPLAASKEQVKKGKSKKYGKRGEADQEEEKTGKPPSVGTTIVHGLLAAGKAVQKGVKRVIAAVFPPKGGGAAKKASGTGAGGGAGGGAGAGAGARGGSGGALIGAGGLVVAGPKFYALLPDELAAVREEYERIWNLPPDINTDLYTIPGFGSLFLQDVLSIAGLLEDKLICAILQCIKNNVPVQNPPVQNTIMYPCFYTMIKKSDVELRRLARIFNHHDKNYLKGKINWVINIPGHWFFCGVRFLQIDADNRWHYDILLGDSIKGISRDDVLKRVQLFIRAAVSFLHREPPNNENLLPATAFVFSISKYNNPHDRISPAQRDNTSCGVHSCANAYFFMRENRLATYNDYSPDRAGVQALKTKFLEYLMQANAMATQFPDMVPVQDPAGPAGDLLHQYNANYMVPQTDAERRAVEEESMLQLALDKVRDFEKKERRALPQNEKDKITAAVRISAEAHRELVLEEERQIQEALRISANEIKTATNLGNAKDTLLDVIPLFE
jgi:hypothetical protein